MAKTFLKLLSILVITFSFYINVISAEEHSHFNASALMKNERLLGKLVDCVLDEGPCIGPIRHFKKLLPQYMETDCEVCQKEIKALSGKVMAYIRDNKPDMWEKMQEISQSDEDHREKLKQQLEAIAKTN